MGVRMWPNQNSLMLIVNWGDPDSLHSVTPITTIFRAKWNAEIISSAAVKNKKMFWFDYCNWELSTRAVFWGCKGRKREQEHPRIWPDQTFHLDDPLNGGSRLTTKTGDPLACPQESARVKHENFQHGANLCVFPPSFIPRQSCRSIYWISI